MTIYSLDVLLFLFGTSLLFHVQFQTVASWPAYRFLKRQVRWSGIPISYLAPPQINCPSSSPPLLTSCLSSAISDSFRELQIFRCWKASRMFIREYLWPGTCESEGRETGLGREGKGWTVIWSQWRGLSWPSGSYGAQIFQVRTKGWAFVSGCGLPLERNPTLSEEFCFKAIPRGDQQLKVRFYQQPREVSPSF